MTKELQQIGFNKQVKSSGAKSIASDNNIAINGTFSADTDWTKGTGWTIAAGVATSDASQAADSLLTQTSSRLMAGRTHFVSFVVTARSGGTVRARIGDTEGTSRSAVGTYQETIKHAGAGLDMIMVGDADFAGSIDNLIVIPL